MIPAYVLQMKGFPTAGKRPLYPWRNEQNRWMVSLLLSQYEEVGIIPAEHGCVVIDLDVKDGRSGVVEFKKAFKNIPRSLNYKTRSGGCHLWYRVPEGTKIGQSNGRIPCVDVRYADGYVCIRRDYCIKDDRVADCPPELLEWLMSAPVAEKRRKAVRPCPNVRPTKQYDLSPFPAGRRNDLLYRWGYGLLNGVDKGELSIDDLRDLIHVRGTNSGLGAIECDVIANSILEGVR